MKRNARTAYNALQRLGAPLFDRSEHSAQFILGAELRTNDDVHYADYYQEYIREHYEDESLPVGQRKVINAFGIREDVHRILRANGLYAEWINPAMVGIYID